MVKLIRDIFGKYYIAKLLFAFIVGFAPVIYFHYYKSIIQLDIAKFTEEWIKIFITSFIVFMIIKYIEVQFNNKTYLNHKRKLVAILNDLKNQTKTIENISNKKLDIYHNWRLLMVLISEIELPKDLTKEETQKIDIIIEVISGDNTERICQEDITLLNDSLDQIRKNIEDYEKK